MKIAMYGTGPIGSTFAFHLARAGHEITAIARGERLRQLEADRAIVLVDGERAPVTPSAQLPPDVAYDLVLVTVRADKLAPVLPALRASAARTVMFMFNTFAPLATLREAVGEARFAFGFPAILASLPDGRLKAKIVPVGQTTISTDPEWARLFTDAGIRAVVERDMESWLRTHAVMIAALMSMATRVHERGAGVQWAEAGQFARGLREGLALVQQLGNRVTPPAMALMQRAPVPVATALLWAFSRTPVAREIGAIGPDEPRALVDAMLAAAPAAIPTLRALRP
jgi:2-dehydropantoate 2-reductase